MIELEDSTFQEETKEGITVIDFYADWCGPCRAIMPTVEAMAKSYEGTDVKVVKVNVDNCPILQQQFGIRSIPAFVVIKDEIEIARQVGSASLVEKIQGIIEKIKQS